jgi:hypothetical protein
MVVTKISCKDGANNEQKMTQAMKFNSIRFIWQSLDTRYLLQVLRSLMSFHNVVAVEF